MKTRYNYNSNIQWNLWIKDTLGPASHFVLCREVVRSLKVQNVLIIWENEHLKYEHLKCVTCKEVISVVSSSRRVLYQRFLYWRSHCSYYICTAYVAVQLIFIFSYRLISVTRYSIKQYLVLITKLFMLYHNLTVFPNEF